MALALYVFSLGDSVHANEISLCGKYKNYDCKHCNWT